MNTYTYTVSGGNQENFGGAPMATGSLSTFSVSLTGSTNVTFALSGLSSYDDHAIFVFNTNISQQLELARHNGPAVKSLVYKWWATRFESH